MVSSSTRTADPTRTPGGALGQPPRDTRVALHGAGRTRGDTHAMDFSFSPAEEQLRSEIRAFLQARLPADWDTAAWTLDPDGEERRTLARELRRQLGEHRWLAAAWPEEFGGRGARQIQQTLINEELAAIDSPADPGQGVHLVGPALMLFGSPEQQQRYLPRIARGHDQWATLYSEPGAGSDLASIQTTAIRDGDEYILNGHKIWASGAAEANMGWVAARTDPHAPKHRGISTFVMPMDAPGVEIRPVANMAGSRRLTEVFLHNVRVPAEHLVGTEHRGWYQAATTLDYERSGVATFATGRRHVEHLVRMVRQQPELTTRHPATRYELADRWIELQVGFNIAYRIPLLQEQGIAPNHESSVSRLYGAEMTQRIAATGIELLGMAGQLAPGSEFAPLGGALARGYLESVGATIAGGTSEVQRNVIAQRGLGLPRA